jgi:hypothetical protein
MGYVVLALTWALGAAILVGGFYVIRHKRFPTWWKGALLWPLVEVTPKVARLQGWAAVAIGASIAAIGLGALLQDITGGILVIVGMAGYVVGVGLFGYSTWLSRRETG